MKLGKLDAYGQTDYRDFSRDFLMNSVSQPPLRNRGADRHVAPRSPSRATGLLSETGASSPAATAFDRARLLREQAAGLQHLAAARLERARQLHLRAGEGCRRAAHLTREARRLARRRVVGSLTCRLGVRRVRPTTPWRLDGDARRTRLLLVALALSGRLLEYSRPRRARGRDEDRPGSVRSSAGISRTLPVVTWYRVAGVGVTRGCHAAQDCWSPPPPLRLLRSGHSPPLPTRSPSDTK